MICSNSEKYIHVSISDNTRGVIVLMISHWNFISEIDIKRLPLYLRLVVSVWIPFKKNVEYFSSPFSM